MTIKQAARATAARLRQAVNSILHGLFDPPAPDKQASAERHQEDSVFQTDVAQVRTTPPPQIESRDHDPRS